MNGTWGRSLVGRNGFSDIWQICDVDPSLLYVFVLSFLALCTFLAPSSFVCDADSVTAAYLQQFSYDVCILYRCAVSDDANDNVDSHTVNHFRFFVLFSRYCYLANFQ